MLVKRSVKGLSGTAFKNLSRRDVLVLGASASVALEYPTRQVTIVVPVAAGGAVDFLGGGLELLVQHLHLQRRAVGYSKSTATKQRCSV